MISCNLFATSLNDIDCGQLQIDVTNSVYNLGLGLTWTEAQMVGDAAYEACLATER